MTKVIDYKNQELLFHLSGLEKKYQNKLIELESVHYAVQQGKSCIFFTNQQSKI